MENKTLLHIIPCIPEYENRIKEIDKEELDNAGFWYLHGSLVDIFHFDKAVMTNCKTLGLKKTCTYDNDKEPISKLHYNGEIECEVEGCDIPCIAFLYTREYDDQYWIQRGLVCAKDDIDACNYARKKMNEKSTLL